MQGETSRDDTAKNQLGVIGSTLVAKTGGSSSSLLV